MQLANIASLPFIHHHVAALPDVHLGIGATIGSVIAARQAIIPAAVGVDIGCGMVAARQGQRREFLFQRPRCWSAHEPHGRDQTLHRG